MYVHTYYVRNRHGLRTELPTATLQTEKLATFHSTKSLMPKPKILDAKRSNNPMVFF